MLKKFLLCFLFLSWQLAHSQDVAAPLIHNFPPKVYKAQSQNWAILQDARGIMYFGNNSGLLEFDGASWKVIPMPNSSVVRSLSMNKSNVVYIGASNELGYLGADSVGNPRYISLKSKLPKENQDFQDVWKVFTKDHWVCFISSEYVFIYDTKTKKFKVLSPLAGGDVFHVGFMAYDEIYIRQKSLGLLRLTANFDLEMVPGGEEFKDIRIYSIVPYSASENVLLILTREKGCFLYDKSSGQLAPMETPVNKFCTDYLIYGCKKLSSGNYVIYTLTNGIGIFNQNLEIIDHVNKHSGLVDQSVTYAYEDMQGDLWLGLGNGIAKVDISLPISKVLISELESSGNILDFIRFENKSYVTAGQTAYYIDELNQVVNIQGLSSQCWQFLPFKLDDDHGHSKKEVLLLAAGNGLFEIVGNSARLLNNLPSRKLCQSKLDPHRLFMASFDGIFSFYYQNGSLIQERFLPGNNQISYEDIMEDNNGNLWCTTDYSGILRASPIFTEDKKGIKAFQITKYDTLDGLPMLNNIGIGKYYDHMIFTTQKGIYEFDFPTSKFVRAAEVEKTLRIQGEMLRFFVQEPDKSVWIAPLKTSDSPIKLSVFNKESGTFTVDSTTFRAIPENEVSFIYPHSDKTTHIGGSEGVFFYDRTKSFTPLKNKVFLRRIMQEENVIFGGFFLPGEDSGEGVFPLKQSEDMVPRFSNAENSFVFSFGLSSYSMPENNKYSFYLENYDETWSDWSADTKKEYTNLPEGTFVFHLKGKDVFGVETDEITFKFVILTPWYKSTLMYLVYFALFIVGLRILLKLNSQRLQRANLRLESLVEKRTAEVKQKNQELEQQKEEILLQKNQTEQAYKNVTAIGEIGQAITSMLDFTSVIGSMFEHLKPLMDISCVGVGIYSNKHKNIRYKNTSATGESDPLHLYTEEDEANPAMLCFTQNKELLYNDILKEYPELYKQKNSVLLDQNTYSVLFMPLVMEGTPIGLITIQSAHSQAFDPNRLSLLRSLASYASIALSNANAYDVIKNKNRHITDSIRYAQTIQQAILPSDSLLKKSFADYFVIYKPKDIVSGDFYWYSDISSADRKRFIIAAVDCTGHGVPGAFMSMIGNTILNEIVNQKDISNTAEILTQLHEGVKVALKQDEKANSDGMDVCLCLVEYGHGDEVNISFTGAKRPLFFSLLKSTEIQELKGDNKSIGGMTLKEKQFTVQQLSLSKGSRIYLTTDGFVDQNNQSRKKLGTSAFKSLLEQSALESLKTQYELIHSQLEVHQEEAEQRDDITIIGIEL